MCLLFSLQSSRSSCYTYGYLCQAASQRSTMRYTLSSGSTYCSILQTSLSKYGRAFQGKSSGLHQYPDTVSTMIWSSCQGVSSMLFRILQSCSCPYCRSGVCKCQQGERLVCRLCLRRACCMRPDYSIDLTALTSAVVVSRASCIWSRAFVVLVVQIRFTIYFLSLYGRAWSRF